LDFSGASYLALQQAIALASHFQAKLLLAHIVPTSHGIPPDPAYIFEGPQGFQEQQKVAAEDRMAITAQKIPAEMTARTIVGTGDAAEEIVRLATSEGADVIVIATHGTTGWRHLVFGSVAEKVIRLSERPVLVIPAHHPEN
jgi:nucleotide-binding universal stress UspA family protein